MKKLQFSWLKNFLLTAVSCTIIPLEAAHQVAENGKAKMAIVYKKCENPKNQAWDPVFQRHNTPDFAARELAELKREWKGELVIGVYAEKNCDNSEE